MTYRNPSSDRVQLSASQGSISSVTWLTRTSRACVRRVTRTVVASGLTQLQNDRGSVLTDTVRSPPLRVVAAACGTSDDRRGESQAVSPTTASGEEKDTERAMKT